MEQYLKQGLVSDSKVLDIRQVDVRVTLPRPWSLAYLLSPFADLGSEDPGERHPRVRGDVPDAGDAHLPEREDG